MIKGYIFVDLETLNFVDEPELVTKLVDDGWLVKGLSYVEDKLTNFISKNKLNQDNKILVSCPDKSSLYILLSTLVGGVFTRNDDRKVVLLSKDSSAKTIAKLMSSLGHDCEAPLTNSLLDFSTDKKAREVRDYLRQLTN